jgi:site-specific DNA recombinase
VNAAVYARYSSENQRPESILDQVSSCRKLAAEKGYVIADEHIYSDMAASGARKDRRGLNALLAASEGRLFDIVLVDDLSRLARDNFLMLSVLADLRFRGVRVISVADGLDSEDEEAAVSIQVRGIFNELQLQDLRKKTLRGQIGQKERGFSVGERTFGYRSVPVGTMRMDKKGRPRPDGYRMEIDPAEARIVLRIFEDFANGRPLSAIVRRLNEEGVLGRFRSRKTWSPSTLSRILRNEKYTGLWVWNKQQTRRDPRTGRRKRFPKPESEWVVHRDEALRIVSQELWVKVQKRREETTRTWPGGRQRGQMSRKPEGWVKHYPDQLLSGAMACGLCGGSIAQVSGKSGGYYGCLGAARGRCENRLLVRRTLAERVVVGAVEERLSEPEVLQDILRRVETEVLRLYADVPQTITLKESELKAAERKLANLIEFIGEGRGSKALALAVVATEKKADQLREEIDDMKRSRDAVFQAPPLAWIEHRVGQLKQVLEGRTQRSALALRKLLGPIRLEPVTPDLGRPYYRAQTTLQTLSLMEDMPGSEGSDPGSTSVRWWTWSGSNRRPRECHSRALPTAPQAHRVDGEISSSLARWSTERLHTVSGWPRGRGVVRMKAPAVPLPWLRALLRDGRSE